MNCTPISPPVGCRRSRLLVSAILTLVTVAGAALRCYRIDASLWLDELHTAWTVADSFGNLIDRAAIGNYSPVYFTMPWAVAQVAGLDEWSIRLPSLVTGVGLIPLTFAVLVYWTRCPSAALLGACLVAIDSHCILFSQEARVYAIVQLVGLGQILAFTSTVRHGKWRQRIAYVGLTGLLFYLHYTTLLLVVAEFAWYGLFSGRQRRITSYAPWKFLTDLALVALLCAPAANHIMQILQRRTNWAMFVPLSPASSLLSIFPLDIYVLLPACLLALSIVIVKMKSHPVGLSVRRVDPWLYEFAVCWLCVPLVVAWMATATESAHMFLLRYVIVSAIAPIVIACLMYTRVPSSWLRTMFFTVVVSTALVARGPVSQVVQYGALMHPGHEDWRGAVALIKREDPTDRLPVLVYSGLIEADGLGEHSPRILREYCLLPVTTIYRIERREADLVPLPTTRLGHLSKSQVQRITRCGGMWLIYRGGPAAARKTVAAIRRAHGMRAECRSVISFEGVAVAKVVVQNKG